MYVSYNWLNNYVDLGEISPEDLAERITKSGIEIEGIEYIGESIDNLVVGHVLTCEKHPDADKLSICSVDVGAENLQIICGAPNIAQGQKVIVAKPGAVLPGNFKIKKAKIRGVESNGMICSLQELGIKEKFIPQEFVEGIFVLPESVEAGEDVAPLINLNDAILELDVLANRADALSMLGVAYEVAAILDKPIKLPGEELTNQIDESIHDYISVKVEAEDLNPYYGAFVVKDVVIKSSPLWMQNYLLAAGIRPINNVVDITNYVLLEYGQPLHAFDYEKFDSNNIVVRRANEGEEMVTLDKQTRKLTAENLVITNGSVPTALAGVMGGADSEVTNETRTILLEAAYFDSSSVRRTVKQTGLRSESSTRFEKGVDPNRVKKAGLRACHLLEKYADGKVVHGVSEHDTLNYDEKTVEINTDKVNDRLGSSISKEEIASILKRLKFNFEQSEKDFKISVPTRRQDITIFEDMLEEVARMYGYDNLPFTLPSSEGQVGRLSEAQRVKREVKAYLQGVGLMENRTYSLTDEANSEKLISPEILEQNPVPVELSKPMSEDHKYLRLSILPDLIRSLTYNSARNQSNIAYYEAGSIFVSDEKVISKQPQEISRLSGAMTGNWLENKWQAEVKPVDFYVVKGIVEGLFDLLKLDVTFEQAQLNDMHPGRTAVIKRNNEVIGFLGQLHPRLAKEADLKEVYVFDIHFDAVIDAYENIPSFTGIPRYPAITRDIAFILDEDISAGDVKTLIYEIGAPLVKQVDIFDVYEGEHLEEGKKSIAYHLVYQDPEKTLKDDEVEASYQQVVKAVADKYNGYVRS
ncbi:phenylalanine--tRNA ligase subunit beta [Oceanobacillus sp. CAU 1775]